MPLSHLEYDQLRCAISRLRGTDETRSRSFSKDDDDKVKVGDVDELLRRFTAGYQAPNPFGNLKGTADRARYCLSAFIGLVQSAKDPSIAAIAQVEIFSQAVAAVAALEKDLLAPTP